MSNPTKAANYIHLLDEARCNGNWDAVPELVRKVRKHAPDRVCLTLTAETEYHTLQHIKSRPDTAQSEKSEDLSKYLAPLEDAAENEKSHPEEAYQAHVCIGWLHYLLGDPASTISRLSSNTEQDFAQVDGSGKRLAGWTKVSILKSLYLKGVCQKRTGAPAEALITFESALPNLATSPSSGGEARLWGEMLLTSFCMLCNDRSNSDKSSKAEAESLEAFRAWGKFWEQPGQSIPISRGYRADATRREVWFAYYANLSDILQQDLPYSADSLANTEMTTRLQLKAELQRVETIYEGLLLEEIPFPKAEESSPEVEEFVGIVTQNWRILCGKNWHEHDLGDGGREACTRNVLDILYRAATKTFHSTPILRHLFTVHLAVAEFNLAIKAFDTYFGIVEKGKAREEKTGEIDPGLDSDEFVLQTATECIRALCRYGDILAAEKAHDLGHWIETWLDKHHPYATETNGTNGNKTNQPLTSEISPYIISKSWLAVGISQAQWARMTYDATSRIELQDKAISSLQKALDGRYSNSNDIEALFALGSLLAEKREIDAAISVVKTALLPSGGISGARTAELGPEEGDFARERALIPLWHLLALLLSARQEFIIAARACEGAFEQFQDPEILFGHSKSTFKSEHLSEKFDEKAYGIVDDMEDFEKQNVLEVKITQLALLEVLEGSEVAVNASDELLSLYARLFGDPTDTGLATTQPPAILVPVAPKSSAGTIRTIKGSIFGRSGRAARKASLQQDNTIEEDKANALNRPQTAQTIAANVSRAPTIQVTNENGGPEKERHHRHQSGNEHSRKRNASVPRTQSSAGGRRDRSASASHGGMFHGIGLLAHTGKQFLTSPTLTDKKVYWLNDANGTGTKEAQSSRPGDQLPPNSQNMLEQEPQLLTNGNQGHQDTRLPHISHHSSSTSPNPLTRFSKDQIRRRRVAILIKVWLLIAGFYRRAALYEDAQGAIDEAFKLVEILEVDVSKDVSGSISAEDAGWGGGRSVVQLWGDVWAERGELSQAQKLPYEALSDFESALTRFPDHPSATVGLSTILLDIYSKVLPPVPVVPILDPPRASATTSTSNGNATTPIPPLHDESASISARTTQPAPLGLPVASPISTTTEDERPSTASTITPSSTDTPTSTLDRLAARDRAYGLLSALTKLGSGWNFSGAWFTLARAYEEGGQIEKAREVYWWCLELEEGMGVREWSCVGGGGYVL